MNDVLEVAIAAARAAGRVALDLASELEVEHKAGAELVTRADFACQERIARINREEFPYHGFLGEEGGGGAAVSAGHVWIVDPIDGTTNYVHGIPQFAVSIAYAERGETLVGVVLDPVRDELFAAVRGEGATLNGRPIHVAERTSLDTVVVATGFYYDRGEAMERTLSTIRRLFGCGVRGIRRFGAAALDLCWIACGRFDAFFEYRLSVWDFAAAALIIREAGGRTEDRSGRPADLTSSSVVAANPALFDDFADQVRWR